MCFYSSQPNELQQKVGSKKLEEFQGKLRIFKVSKIYGAPDIFCRRGKDKKIYKFC